MSIASSSTFGGPDLDLRPAQLERSNLGFYVRRCPQCSACAPQLSGLLPHLEQVVRGDQYQRRIEDQTQPSLAKLFVCWSMLAESLERYPDAAQAMVHAAWVCDDAGADGSSYRLRALDLFQIAWDRGSLAGAHPAVHLAVLTDLARRAGDFERASQLSVEGLASDPELLVRKVLEFQRGLLERGDRDVHTVEEAEQSMSPSSDPQTNPPSPKPAPRPLGYLRPEYGGPRLGFGAPRELGPPDRGLYAALEDARAQGDRLSAIQAHVDLAAALRQLRSIDIAMEHASAALGLSREGHSNVDIGGCLSITGALRYDLGDYEGALADHRSARECLEHAGEHEAAAWCDVSAGVCLSVLGDFDGALTAFERARLHFKQAGHVQAVDHMDGLITQANRSMDQTYLGIESPDAVTSCALCKRQIFVGQTYSRCMVEGCSIHGESLCMACGSKHAKSHG
jgi:tetratricopeptide (TPR) repeat protein